MKKVRIKDINDSLEDYDVFICSASFEERCLIVPQKLKNKKFLKVIAIQNKHGSSLIKDNGQAISKFYKDNITIMDLSFLDPVVVADSLAKELKDLKIKKSIKILIDITAFTHENLLIFLKVLKLNKKINKITCVYINAKEYCPGVELQKKWLSRGCGELHSVLGYAGMMLPSRKLHLIVIVGYEYNRAFEIITSIEPNSLTLIYGASNSSFTEKDKEANQVFNELVEQMTFEYSNVESLQLPSNDPYMVSDSLKKIYCEHSEDNVMIIPMNNKVSTIGVYLSMDKNEDVQICYAPAIAYNESNYSLVGRYCYIFDLT